MKDFGAIRYQLGLCKVTTLRIIGPWQLGKKRVLHLVLGV